MKETIPLALAVLLPLTGGGLTAFAQGNLTPPPAKGVAAESEIPVRVNAQTTTEERTLPLVARPIYNGSPNQRPVPDWKRKGLRQKGLFPDLEHGGLSGTEKIDRSDVVDDNTPRNNMALQFAEQWGVTVEQAIQRMESQGARIALGEQITERLGARAVGFFLDQLNDTIIVNVLDEDAAFQVRSLGATARLVHRSWEKLEAIQESLTSRFAIVDTEVGIDEERNQVLVTIFDGEGAELPDSLQIPSTVNGLSTSRDEALSALIHACEAFGDAVFIEHRPGAFTPLLKGGGKIGVQRICMFQFREFVELVG
ncbi:MAG: hypothetical protein L0Y39_06750 [Methylococcaceae bacterium]|nr:hypothetical protein [Methylococcaceae bacterium]